MVERRHLLLHLELAAHAFGADQTVRVPVLPPRAVPTPAQDAAADQTPRPAAGPAAAAAAPPSPAPARPPQTTAPRRPAAASATDAGQLTAGPRPGPPPTAAAGADDPVASALAALRREILTCSRCPLHGSREHAVPGEGNPRAEVFFVGEAPGATEDRAGRPFVGPSGELLDRILSNAMGLQRSDVFIANVVKCRPPGNRTPEPDEVAACLPYLQRQIEQIQPKVIVCLGRVAAQSLLGGDEAVSRLRGRELSHRGIPVVVTWHPAYLLREPAAKRDTWDDIKRVNRLLGRPDVPAPGR
jgi:uracil-DNA glycosylase family 4